METACGGNSGESHDNVGAEGAMRWLRRKISQAKGQNLNLKRFIFMLFSNHFAYKWFFYSNKDRVKRTMEKL